MRYLNLQTILPAVAMLLFIAPAVCKARIGETPEQSDQRFGKPVPAKDELFLPPDTERRDYVYNGIRVVAFFLHGKSQQEIYCKPTGDLSDVEIDSLLDANSFGTKWQVEFNTARMRSWTWGEGRLQALLVHGAPTQLVISTSAYKQAESEAKKAGDKQRTNGF